ncbi:MAG TPA: response regulator transcription factor [Stellaceae bacterium]|jgi:two-component system nitrate/nitrite response regulator NarL|nr:response regulator transcription factor [Stellaceae bacterium]
MRILLADDHHLVREAIASYLMRAAADIVCIEASDLQQVRERLAGDNTFDLIILDYRMPGMKGLAGLDEVKEALPGTPVAILSGAMDADEAERALERGAAGVIMKNLRGTALLTALRLMAAGETYVPRSVVNALPGRHAARQSFDNLTPRELDCIEHLVRGSPNREIAERLAISEITVKLHLNSAFKKMGARNRSDAVRIAMLQGMSGI